MGLIKDTQNTYYTGNDFGSYQFTSLDDIITQFEIAYVGENKIIPKIKRADIAFHAMRALQELSFDTFKSVKAHQIDLPPSLTMILPHDYVNYTKLSWVDSAGIKHPLYPTNSTSNPHQIKQKDDGDYFFGVESERLVNFDFSDPLANTWNFSDPKNSHAWSSTYANTATTPKHFLTYIDDTIGLNNGELEFSTLWSKHAGSRAYGAWQRIDTSLDEILDLTAVGSSGDRITDGSTIICDYGIVRVGITTTNPSVGWGGYNASAHSATWSGSYDSPNDDPTLMDLGYVEWSDGSSSQKELLDIDVTNYSAVWIWITSTSPFTPDAITPLEIAPGETVVGTIGGIIPLAPPNSVYNTHQKNTVDQVSVIMPGNLQVLSNENSDGNSSTWNNYKSNTPSENNNDDYEDDTYWPANGERYGLDPQHAQANGSFYIDNRLGKINFSSNISGKTVILDYISDSLGTDAEMQVHKFAEDAMYKWIAHAILSTSSYGQGLVRRLTREKFAATRKAKLRLSNIKLEELTQILRGKSKQIKH